LGFGSLVFLDNTGYSFAASWAMTDSTVTDLKLNSQASQQAASTMLVIANNSAAMSTMSTFQASDTIVLRWVGVVDSDSMTACDWELVVVGSIATA